jgi:hypothetical protein
LVDLVENGAGAGFFPCPLAGCVIEENEWSVLL